MAQSEMLKAGLIVSLVVPSPAMVAGTAMAAESKGQSSSVQAGSGQIASTGPGPTVETSCGLLVLSGATTQVKPYPNLKVLNSASVKLPKIDSSVLAVTCNRDSVLPVAGDERALKGHAKPFIINDGVRSGTLSLEKGKYKFGVSGGQLTKLEDAAVKAQIKKMQGDADAVAKKKSDGNKVAGCIAGGLLVGLLAAAASSKNSRGGAAVAGFAAGCALGWTFAKNWSEKDKQGLDQASQDALDNPNGTMDWQAPESGTPVRFRAVNAAERNEDVEFQHVENVEAPPEGSKVISRPYRTAARLALRSSPDSSSADNILGRYNTNQTVEVVGLTPDGEWAMVGDQGVVIGYALRTGLVETGQSLRTVQTERYYVDTPAPARATPARTKAKVKAKAPVMMAQVAPPVSVAKVKTVKVAATTQCKSLTAATGQQQQSKTGCNRPGGKWVFA